MWQRFPEGIHYLNVLGWSDCWSRSPHCRCFRCQCSRRAAVGTRWWSINHFCWAKWVFGRVDVGDFLTNEFRPMDIHQWPCSCASFRAHRFQDQDPLVISHIATENCPWTGGFTHWKWSFSIVMLNYQRGPIVFFCRTMPMPRGSPVAVDQTTSQHCHIMSRQVPISTVRVASYSCSCLQKAQKAVFSSNYSTRFYHFYVKLL